MRSRNKILDAVRDVIARSGFSGVTIASVAQTAGVTRQTVYSIFGTREDLVSQAVAEHLTEIVDGVHERLRTAPTPADYVVDLIVACRTIVRSDPVLAALLRTDGDNPLFDAGALDRARAVGLRLLSPLQELFPETALRLDDIVDISVHLGWSAVCFDDPSVRTDEDLRRFLGRWLAPAFAASVEE
ncbi:TetR/AcrR family transcriptional regulator [Rhodococcus triatomae]|nr:TetR/AcrR family transcriptional regulator [Rhodococcus triatomae]QNG20318.1 TetR/AcrR family transcriptional regulator [Rhodococcus triatomae]QNG23766.1 TetR/AcrR family transcriptional regulator [Rhodococcus triatomae]